MEKQQETIIQHSGRTKRRAEEVSVRHDQKHIHRRTTSPASGVGLKPVTASTVRRRITLVVRKGSAPGALGSDKPDLEQHFERTRARLTSYFKSMEGSGHALPENPKAPGEVFFEQVEAESGLPLNTLMIQRTDGGDGHVARLRGVIENAAQRLGVELRVLPRSPGAAAAPLTYAQILERGTEERRRELQGKGNHRQQLYNTRSALSQFIERSGLDKAAAVGDEFAAGFDGAVGKIAVTFKSEGSLKKFLTELEWWRGFHRGLLKEQGMPEDFRGALTGLIEASGLSLRMVANLSRLPPATLKVWCDGRSTPARVSYNAVSRMEKLFKLPAGTLVNKLSSRGYGRRFHRARLPEFLRRDPQLTHRVTPHLPDDFCELSLERQEEIVASVRADVLRCGDPFALKSLELSKLPYRLKEWPQNLSREFEDLATFKIGERPPLGMRREGQWRLTSAEKMRRDLAGIFGAFSLPGDAEDARVRGLGIPAAHLTLSMLACPLLLDWFIRFQVERRGKYTTSAMTLLGNIKSLVRPGTGWLRQRQGLASRLKPISCGGTELVSRELVARAQKDWDGVCDDAHRHYKDLADEINPLLTVGRDPFRQIGGIVEMDSPMKGLKFLLDEMRACLANKETQPSPYHTGIRNCALVALLAVTGLRRNTLSLLDYGGAAGGHLSRQNGGYVLEIPRSLFKEENSPFFGPKHARKDYFMKLPDVFGLNKLFDEYLNASRPWLLHRFHQGTKECPLFVTAGRGKSVRVVSKMVSQIYKRAATRHLVENRWRGTGIPGVRSHGPHSVRHIRGTEVIKRTGSFQMAADANHNSEEMARKHYVRFLPSDRNEAINELLFEREKDDDEQEE